jgi:hypothetical protein
MNVSERFCVPHPLLLLHKRWGFRCNLMQNVVGDRNGLSNLSITQNGQSTKNFVNVTENHKSQTFLLSGEPFF